ncbi:MAG: pyridoxal-phosphate dependent enzyme [Actinomycetota bacterium]
MAPQDVTVDDVRRARAAVDGVIQRTPVLPAMALSEEVGGDVVYKAENLQRTGSFKLRGALAKIAALGEGAAGGVVTGSAGNHGQALAFAARHTGVPCEIVVPIGAPVTKVEACRSYGATVHEVGVSLAEAVAFARSLADERGLAFCPPFDDPHVVAGQGTLGLEVLDDVPDLASVVVPLGGGGLAAGTAIAIKSVRPNVEIVGVQASACAPYAGDEPPSGEVVTLADGIAVKYPGHVTGPLIDRWLDRIVTVDENSIADAMIALMERSKLYSEGAGAVGVAALRSGAVRPAPSGRTCVILSGGNVDLGVVPGLIRRHEHASGRRLRVFARIDDRPGCLARLLDAFASCGADLIEVEHIRDGLDLHVRETGVNASFAVRGLDHGDRCLTAALDAGFDVYRADEPRGRAGIHR